MNILRTPLCEALGIDVPIFLAGMGIPAGPRLAAAVSNAGGLGVMGGTRATPEELRARIRQLRDLTDRPFGVDLILPQNVTREARSLAEVAQDIPAGHVAYVEELRQRFGVPEQAADVPEDIELRPALGTNTEATVEVILEEQVPVFVAGLGSPGFMVERAHAQGMTVMAVVGSVKQARRVVQDGTDVVIAQGYEGGAHTSHIGTFALLPQVLDAVSPTPVVAAGGVGDGRGLAAALAFGCQAVWVGTRFLATPEADFPHWKKERIVAAAEDATKTTRAYTGKNLRAINNGWMEAWESGPVQPLGMPYQSVLTNPVMLAAHDMPEVQSTPAGQVSGLIQGIRPAADIVRDMVAEAEEIARSFAERLSSQTGR